MESAGQDLLVSSFNLSRLAVRAAFEVVEVDGRHLDFHFDDSATFYLEGSASCSFAYGLLRVF